MNHSFLKLVVPIAAIVLAGCTQVQTPAADPGESHLTLAAECVVNYYRVDGSAYATQQKHRFVPATGQLQVRAEEPTGTFEYTLQQDQFVASQKSTDALSDLPESFSNPELATLVFYSICAGGALLDTANMPAEEPIKIQGQWYIPLKPAWPIGDRSVTLFQNQTSGQIELIQISDAAQEIVWLARSYNLRYNSDLEKRLPRSIDIFDIQGGIASKKLMVQFQYKDIDVSR